MPADRSRGGLVEQPVVSETCQLDLRRFSEESLGGVEHRAVVRGAVLLVVEVERCGISVDDVVAGLAERAEPVLEISAVPALAGAVRERTRRRLGRRPQQVIRGVVPSIGTQRSGVQISPTRPRFPQVRASFRCPQDVAANRQTTHRPHRDRVVAARTGWHETASGSSARHRDRRRSRRNAARRVASGPGCDRSPPGRKPPGRGRDRPTRLVGAWAASVSGRAKSRALRRRYAWVGGAPGRWMTGTVSEGGSNSASTRGRW